MNNTEQKDSIIEQKESSKNNEKKYRKRVSSIVTEINNELNKILASSSKSKNVTEVESDIQFLSKKINEVKKALSEKNNEHELSNVHSNKILKALDKLIDVASKNDISEEDQKAIIKELKTNFSEANSFINLIKKALVKSEHTEEFKLD